MCPDGGAGGVAPSVASLGVPVPELAIAGEGARAAAEANKTSGKNEEQVMVESGNGDDERLPGQLTIN